MTGGRLKRVRHYSATRTFCFTYGDGVADVDITAAGRLPPRAGHARDRDRGAAAGPLRRARARRRSRRARFDEKPHGDGALDQRRLLRLVAEVVDYIEGDDTRLGAGAARAASRGAASCRRTVHRRLLAADGHAARPEPARGALGVRRRRRGRTWDSAGSRVDPRRSAGRRVLVTGHTGFKGAGSRSGCDGWAPR